MIKRLGLGRQEKVKKKHEFKTVFDAGKRYSNNLISIIFHNRQISTENNSARRLGIIASRKVGIAVQRNRLKRLIREIFRINKHNFKAPVDLVVILKPASRAASRVALQTGFLELCKKAHLI